MPLAFLPVVGRITARLPEVGHRPSAPHHRTRTAIAHLATNIAGLLSLGLLLGVASCASIGPGTVPRDRVDYITAVADSWKEQTLLNVVRMRYGDAPSFVDVSSVISAYAFQGQVAAGGRSVPT